MADLRVMGVIWLAIAVALIVGGWFAIAALARRLRAPSTLQNRLLLAAGMVAVGAFVLAGGCFGVFGVGFLTGDGGS